MNLSKKNLPSIYSDKVTKPEEAHFSLPEKVVQFGTGVLLRGLPDYFIDKANKQGIFNGRIVVVKSTSEGGTDKFNQQDGLYTLCIRGIDQGVKKETNSINASISRVLSANAQWGEILQCAHNPTIKIIISNTTEAGIQLLQESIFQKPPQSFPAKLLAFLHERYQEAGHKNDSGFIIIPTELISDNGKILHNIILDLAHFNKLDEAFIHWLQTENHFCNSLVDCIVPGKPAADLQKEIENEIGYTDQLLIMSEVYRLWAIQGNAAIKEQLTFSQVSDEVVIAEDITRFKELKLRLLNGTHILSSGLAFLMGISTVGEAMNDERMKGFIKDLMLKEIAPNIPFSIPLEEAEIFGMKVLDRFSNPFIHHPWINITLNYSSKIMQRIVPVLQRHYEASNNVPKHIGLGFAAYLLFMRPINKNGEKFFGEWVGKEYPINDEWAPFYLELWKNETTKTLVKKALQEKRIWQTDLTMLKGFESYVWESLESLMKEGVGASLEKFG